MEKIDSRVKRNIEMDLLKGVAIFLVVFGHLISNESVMFRYINTFHMPLFFFISGYFAYDSFYKYDIKKIVYDKFRRLVIPFVCVSLLAVVMNTAMSFLEKGELSWQTHFLSSFIYAKSAWFLIVLFITLIFQSLLVFLKNKNLFWVIVLFTILIYIFAPNEIFMLGKFKTMLPFFEVGYLIKSKNILKNSDSGYGKNIFFVIMSALYIGLLAIYFDYDEFIRYSYYNFDLYNIKNNIIQYFYYTFVSFCGIIFAFYIVTALIKILKLSCVMGDIGKYSLDIYIIHPFVIKIISLFPVLKLFEYGVIPFCFQLILAIIITILCWQGSSKILYKVPLYRRLFAPQKIKK